MSLIEFWPGVSADLNLRLVAANAVPVKGKAYRDPCRLLEVYASSSAHLLAKRRRGTPATLTDSRIREDFLPRIPGVTVRIAAEAYHPPFLWSDCPPSAIAASLAYTTNAVYRILSNLAELGLLPWSRIDHLLDQTCLLLTRVYQSNAYSFIKFINNNLNMFIVSKAIETLVGKKAYDTEMQEIDLTSRALDLALGMVREHVNLSPKQQMALAMGRGIAFLEKYSRNSSISKGVLQEISQTAYQYIERGIAIDDRDRLINKVRDAHERQRSLVMCAILDDTAESVADLLWMQQMMSIYPHFRVNLLANTAQISVNFANHMLDTVLRSEFFRGLAERLGSQFLVTRTYYPLISLQTNLLDRSARKAIANADFVFVKGLNFFETCQIPEKDVFHSFVVYGPVSMAYTGLPHMAGVFAFLPAGVAGYRHNADPSAVETLAQVWKKHNRTDVQTAARQETTPFLDHDTSF